MINLELTADNRSHVLEYQGLKKSESANGHYSQQQTINLIIREHREWLPRMRKKKPRKSMGSDGQN